MFEVVKFTLYVHYMYFTITKKKNSLNRNLGLAHN